MPYQPSNVVQHLLQGFRWPRALEQELPRPPEEEHPAHRGATPEHMPQGRADEEAGREDKGRVEASPGRIRPCASGDRSAVAMTFTGRRASGGQDRRAVGSPQHRPSPASTAAQPLHKPGSPPAGPQGSRSQAWICLTLLWSPQLPFRSSLHSRPPRLWASPQPAALRKRDRSGHPCLTILDDVSGPITPTERFRRAPSGHPINPCRGQVSSPAAVQLTAMSSALSQFSSPHVQVSSRARSGSQSEPSSQPKVALSPPATPISAIGWVRSSFRI